MTALDKIDGLLEIAACRENFSAAEVTDMLLDLRNLHAEESVPA